MTPPMIIRQEAPPSYDPGSDLAWAFLATVGALAGSTLLPFVHLSSNMLISGTVMALGLAMAFGGGMVTLLILLTGQRGRRQANLFLSVGVGGLLGALFAALVTPSLLVAQAVLTDEINFATPVASVDIATPTEDAAPEDDLSVAADSEDGDGDGDGDGDADEDADAEEAPAEDSDETEDSDVGDDSDEGEEGEDGVADASTDAQASPSPTPSPRPRPSSSQAPAPTAAPAPRPAAPAPAPPSGSTGMKQVPNEVIHALLSNNVTVKKCFVPLYRAGKLPPRVDVQFYLQPTGKASASKIQQSEFSGSELDTCLSAAIQKVTFPPSSGSGQRITYPFVLQ
jgi:hypothetical protein